MTLPEPGEKIAVLYRRNPHKYTDPALHPLMMLGSVVRHEEIGGFTALLLNYDSLPQETFFQWDERAGEWVDRDFGQPVDSVVFPLTNDMAAFMEELQGLPEHLPGPEGDEQVRPLQELRLRFIGAALEAGWVAELSGPTVYYSDDFPDASAHVSHWQSQALGDYSVEDGRVAFEWPVEERERADWMVDLSKQEDGTYKFVSEAFGDEFHAWVEERDGYHLALGLWGNEETLSYFAAVLPRK
jgi:hypothetical protein